MNRRTLAWIGLAAAATGLSAVVLFIASGTSPARASTLADAMTAFRSLMELRLKGGDSVTRRGALLLTLKELPRSEVPEEARPLIEALREIAKRRAEEAARRLAGSAVPTHRAVRGCALLELGRRREAAEELAWALEHANPEWPHRDFFEEVRAHAIR